MTRSDELRIFALTFFIAVSGYLATLAPDLTWQHWGSDGPELITAAVTLGIPHPPGYPTYVLLGNLFHRLPLGTVAFRFNLFSAICTALAAGFVSVIGIGLSVIGDQYSVVGARITDYGSRNTVYRLPLTVYRLPLTAYRLAPGLTLAFAPLVWSQAVIAEVYGLNLLVAAALLWSLEKKRPFLAGFCCGLSVTTHLSSLLLLPLALGLTPRQRWPHLGLGLLPGLAPLMTLPLLASSSPVVWGDPSNLAGWWWLVSGRIYHANAFALPAARLLPRLQEWSILLLTQFTVAGVPLLVYGLFQLRHDGGHRRRAAILLTTVVSFFTYAAGYNTPDAAVLLLPALMLLVLLIMPAFAPLRGAALLLPLALFLLNFHGQTLRHDRELRPRAERLLQEAEPDAILITPGNATIFTLWYLQHVEGRRPDVALVDANLFAFDWYRHRLQTQYQDLRQLALDDLDAFVEANRASRPFRFVDLNEDAVTRGQFTRLALTGLSADGDVNTANHFTEECLTKN